MRTRRPNGPHLNDGIIPLQLKLASAWVSFMLLYVYVDILGLYLPGTVEDILAGVVWEFQISQTWAVSALVLMAIPILMIVASVNLPPRINRAVNLVVASLYLLVSASNVIGESWTVYYGLALALEVGVLAGILRWAWRWSPSSAERSARAPSIAATP